MRIHAGDLDAPEAVERLRRSIGMLAPGTPVWSREEADVVLRALAAALRSARRHDSP